MATQVSGQLGSARLGLFSLANNAPTSPGSVPASSGGGATSALGVLTQPTATPPLSTPPLPALKPKDLSDPILGQLNSNFSTTWRHIIRLSGGAGPVAIPNTVTASDFQNPSQTEAPASKDSLITLGTALGLFAPGNARASQLQGAFQTSSTATQQVQPLPIGSQIVKGTPASSSAAGSAGMIMYDASFLYIHVGSGWRRVAIAAF